MHITARTESFVAGTGQHHYIDVLALAAIIKRITDFRRRLGRKGIPITRTVDGYLSYAVVEVEKNISVFFNSFPFSHSTNCFYDFIE